MMLLTPRSLSHRASRRPLGILNDVASSTHALRSRPCARVSATRHATVHVNATILWEGTRTKPKSRFGWNFKQASFDTGHLQDLEQYFDRMPHDPWLYRDGHKYRTRRLSTVTGDPDNAEKLVILPRTVLVQTKDINSLYGDVVRTFDDLEAEILKEPAFLAIWNTFVNITGIDTRVERVMVHQIRTKCSPTMFGDPTPEGIHQDGYGVIGIFCAGRRNIQGAATSLYQSPKDAEPIITKVLQPGDAMIANDKKVYHFTGMVEPEGEQEGSRDVFVLVID